MENFKLPVVHQMRSGAPDKIGLWTDGKYDLRSHDMTNLVDYTVDEVKELYLRGEYILPADEGDIKYANWLLQKGIVNQYNILLPQTTDHIVIPYDKFVPKSSIVYRDLEKMTGIKYGKFKSVSVDKFKLLFVSADKSLNRCAIKTETGSGSRGVILIDPDRVHLGGKYVAQITDADVDGFVKFAEKEGCDILIQELIPYEPDRLFKCNVDFVIRGSRLIGYKWDLVNQAQQFTNWDNGHFVRNAYLDTLMVQVTQYLVSLGITDAIMNFECFSDLKSETWMVEFNWRYSNSMFEGQALGIDLISSYIYDRKFLVPEGLHKFARYWQCKLYSSFDNYHQGK